LRHQDERPTWAQIEHAGSSNSHKNTDILKYNWKKSA